MKTRKINIHSTNTNVERNVSTMNSLAKKLVQVKNNRPVTSSKKVAQYFGKAHRRVVQTIKTSTAQNRALQEHWCYGYYRNKQNHKMKMIIMDRDMFMMSVMSFTGQKANIWKWKFVKAFDYMEHQLSNQKPKLPSRTQALKLAYEQSKRIDQQQKRIQQMAPDAKLGHAITVAKTNINVGSFAKILHHNGVNMGRNQLFRWLRNNHYLISYGYEHNIPRQKYINEQLFTVQEYRYRTTIGIIKLNLTTKITPKGQKYFVNKLVK